MKSDTSSYWRELQFWIICLCIGSSLSIVDPGPGISTNQLLNVFQSTSFDVPRDSVSLLGNDTRYKMQAFLKTRFRKIISDAGGSSKGHEYAEQSYQTQVYATHDRIEEVRATNYILVLRGSGSKSEDKPLAILANYDTDMNEPNPMDTNGSGVAALVVLAEYLAGEIQAGRFILKNTVIFAATDTSLLRYELGFPTAGKTGAGELVKSWLPNFLEGRTFAGAIVLDSIMNFDDSPRAQIDSNDFSKSFPTAYQSMSKDEFRGNFLALVHRDDRFDNPLAEALSRNWKDSTKEVNECNQEPKLIDFSLKTRNAYSEAELHFLKSDQIEFWTHVETFPAILLTDTEKYRKNNCAPIRCSQTVVATPSNMCFLRRNVMAVYSTILDLQTDGKFNGVDKAGFSIVTVLGSIFILAVHREITKYF